MSPRTAAARTTRLPIVAHTLSLALALLWCLVLMRFMVLNLLLFLSKLSSILCFCLFSPPDAQSRSDPLAETNNNIPYGDKGTVLVFLPSHADDQNDGCTVRFFFLRIYDG
mmetsp:Transcript_2898/g.7891  ORF Transcript_2898/g.7891 Transcript_2898/m.7891 type:complete len:111 (+) Transcript_2898:2529-2861(+)